MKQCIKTAISLIMTLSLSIALLMPAFAAAADDAQTKAEALKQLGLFKGVSETDFDLDRAPTRTEALIMLIRMLGKESETQSGEWKHPFTDVAAWADKYIGYAYEKGLTKGISETEFGSGSVDSDMYLTFMLRALGYNDQIGDFVWNAAKTLARGVSILPDGVDRDNFLRADAVLISWAALNADMKGGNALAKELISQGVITNDDREAALKYVNEQAPTPVTVSTAAQLEAALSDTAVKAVNIDSVGSPVIVTGELTVPAGVTLTVNRGNDFYIEGTLTNNGTICIMGADSISTDFINYSVMAVQNGGKLINNGAVSLLAAALDDTQDHGPVGGQLRIFDGTFDNSGSVLLQAGRVNTHGGMSVVIDGTFNNYATVIIDGFFLRVENGTFINSSGAVIINNTNIFTEEAGTFVNDGVLTGRAVNA